ncbi:MAG: DsrE family protein [Sulfuricaulis sp.]|uniref:DsrE family protein n=1 Tax=Sulfuricaulis sp. TaxID=2003553 RepID=UPI0025EF1F26|nr:DsrE family protein [Sulfuricaulis sp.]MCR4347971.1 DsrE family protein [Sulfuricaulis sp.]
MRHKQVALIVTVVAGIAAMVYLVVPPQSHVLTEPTPASPATSLTTEEGRYLFNVTLHTPEEIAGLLTRAEELAKTMRADNRRTGIALVLHGPEIEIFTRKNYQRFQKTVDQAVRLDAEGIIEVKMCRTEMKNLGIKEEEVPAFIELVPYGPDEEARLRRGGYVYL